MSRSADNAELSGLGPLRAEGKRFHWVGSRGVMGEGGGLPPSAAPSPAAPPPLDPPVPVVSAGLTVVHHRPHLVMPPQSSNKTSDSIPLSSHCHPPTFAAHTPSWPQHIPVVSAEVPAGISGIAHGPPRGMPTAHPPNTSACLNLTSPPAMSGYSHPPTFAARKPRRPKPIPVVPAKVSACVSGIAHAAMRNANRTRTRGCSV